MPPRYSKKNGYDVKGNQRFKVDSSKFLFNIDTFWYNCDIGNYDDVMESGLLDMLLAGRTNFHDDNECDTISLSLFGYENPVDFKIMGGQKPLYQFSLRNDDIAIYFSRRYRDDGQYPVKVQINQFILWEKGFVHAYAESLAVLGALGFAFGKAKLNRLDFAVHSDQYDWNYSDLSTFVYPINIANDNFPDFVRLNPATGVFETVYFGSRERLLCRIYNKSKEVLKKKKLYFLDLYNKHGMDPSRVWNCEFEIRRDYIKSLKDEENVTFFDDLDECFNKGGFDQLWTFIMDKFNHDSSFWKVLREGAEGKFCRTEGYLTRVNDNNANGEREIAQIRGRLQTLLLNEASNDINLAIKKFLEGNQRYEKRKDKKFEDDVKKKKSLVHSEYINSLVDQQGKKENAVIEISNSEKVKVKRKVSYRELEDYKKLSPEDRMLFLKKPLWGKNVKLTKEEKKLLKQKKETSLTEVSRTK